MARRKRQSIQEIEQPVVQTEQAPVLEWPTAIYARLSIENSKKDDNGESIEGQIEICRDYLEEHPYLHYVETYADNGWTGTNTDRPAFQRLLADIQKGKIKALVIKDFSRFSRDYIEAGNLLENIFPACGVRFISVADRYDSFETDGSASSLLIPLKNLINSYYSKDISRKVATAVHARQMAAAHIPSMIPYGYIKSTTREYRFEPDPETAANVTRIFQMRVDGVSLSQIAKKLEAEGIPSPGRLRYQRGQTTEKRCATAKWSAAGIRQLIKNPTYLGDLVFGRTVTALYLGKPNCSYEPDESKWRVLKNMHEPLVSQEVFNKCKELEDFGRKKRKEQLKKTANFRAKNIPMFLNYLYCGDCSTRMTYRRDRSRPELLTGSYICPGKDSGRCKSRHTISQDKVKAILWQSIQDQLMIFCDYEKVAELLESGATTEKMQEYRNEIKSLTLQMENRRNKREHLYEDFTDGLLTPEDYVLLKKRFDDEYQELNMKLNTVQTRLTRLKKSLSYRNEWVVHMGKFAESSEFSKDMLKVLVRKILVYQDDDGNQRLEIIYKYSAERAMLQAAYDELIGGDNL